MRPFALLVLHTIQEQPTATDEDLAEQLSISVEGLHHIRGELQRAALLLPGRAGWYVPFAGRVALQQVDVERARRQLEQSRQALDVICQVLDIQPGDIQHFSAMTLGMTNHSYHLSTSKGEFIYRMPGEGSAQLVDRRREHTNYQVLEGSGIGDEVVYSDPDSGVKISRFLEGCHTPDPLNREETTRCMEELHRLHQSGLQPPHSFSHRQNILHYEELCLGEGIEFSQRYQRLRQQMFALLDVLDHLSPVPVFCHIDSVPGNFLLDSQGKVTLIDWEYAGGADPLVDPAMWCLSAGYGPSQCDALLETYLMDAPTQEEQLRFYGWLAAGGFMWSLWSRYKTACGEDFSTYGRQQRNYAEEYTRLFHLLWEREEMRRTTICS